MEGYPVDLHFDVTNAWLLFWYLEGSDGLIQHRSINVFKTGINYPAKHKQGRPAPFINDDGLKAACLRCPGLLDTAIFKDFRFGNDHISIRGFQEIKHIGVCQGAGDGFAQVRFIQRYNGIAIWWIVSYIQTIFI